MVHMVFNTFIYYFIILFCIPDEKHKYIYWKYDYNAIYKNKRFFYLLLKDALQYNDKIILYTKTNYSKY